MSSLYRRYRPKQFSQVVGQNHITRVLVRSVVADQISHAYLFSGPRGTGKTTLARLFAKAINCELPKDGEPCGSCELCQVFERNGLLDVIEIDAASNRGIDEVRELRDRIKYSPSQGKYRVYIIDEVHMLTKEAVNALLKTLEEPPRHAVFILATTEFHKLPETIISRCERYHFHLAPQQHLVDLIKTVVREEGLKVADEAIEILAKQAEGSYRDALTLLGNISRVETEVSADELRKIFGLPQGELMNQLYRALMSGDIVLVVKLINEYRNFGGDSVVLIRSLVDHIEEMILRDPEANKIGLHAHIVEELLIGIVRTKSIDEPTGLLLSILIRLAKEQEKVPALPVVGEISPATVPIQVTDVQKVTKTISESGQTDSVRQSIALKQPINFWEQLLQEIKSHNHALYMVVRSAGLDGISEGRLVIIVKYKFYADRLNETKNRKVVESCASKLLGSSVSLECQVKSDLEVAAPSDGTFDAVVEVFELEG